MVANLELTDVFVDTCVFFFNRCFAENISKVARFATLPCDVFSLRATGTQSLYSFHSEILHTCIFFVMNHLQETEPHVTIHKCIRLANFSAQNALEPVKNSI